MRTRRSMGRSAAEQERLERLREAWLAPDFQAEVGRDFPYAELADAVIALRSEHGLTQAELARRVGTTQSVIARLESGRHGVQINLLNRIAAAVGLSWRPVFGVPVAAADVFTSNEHVEFDKVAEIIEFDAFRQSRPNWQSGVVAPPTDEAAPEAQLTMTAPELKEALGRFVDSFSGHAQHDDQDEHRIAEPSGEYNAV